MGPKNKIRYEKNKYNESEKLGELKKSNKTHKKRISSSPLFSSLIFT
jgi:hypothetical protein